MKMAKNIFRVGVIGGRGSGNLSPVALTLHRFHRDVAAEVRTVEMDFSLLPVAAGVAPAVEPVRPARRNKPFTEPEVSKI